MLAVSPSFLIYKPKFYASHDYYVFLKNLDKKYFVGDYLNLDWLVSWAKQMLDSL